MRAVVVVAGQKPALVYVTVYVPTVELAKLIMPVLGLITKPGVLENVPPAGLKAGAAVAPLIWQNGDPRYASVATSRVSTVTVTGVDVPVEPPHVTRRRYCVVVVGVSVKAVALALAISIQVMPPSVEACHW